MNSEFYDPVIKAHVCFKISPYYLTVTINNRTYYFNRENLKFDGTSISYA